MLLPRQAGEELAKAMEIAVFARDGGYASGFETLVGPKGVRLSEAIAAGGSSPFVRQPELLVLTTSSALDVETEQKLWEHPLRPVIWIT